MVIFLQCTIKIKFSQYTWELQKYKSKYFTGKKIQENPAYVQQNWAKNDHELIIYNMII